MNRRSFFAAVSASIAALVLPRIARAKPLPILYGDNKHDDTEALQAFIDGKPVFYNRTGGIISRDIGSVITGGTFSTSKSITIRGSADLNQCIGGCFVNGRWPHA